MINCGCGCGYQLEQYDSRGRQRKYLHGHAGRVKRVIVDCYCGCGTTFLAKETQDRKYIKNHQNKIIGFKKGYTPHNKGKHYIPKNIEQFIDCGKKYRYDGSVKGKDHPMYIDGRTPEMQILRQKFRQTISPIVLKRDNYTCVLCSKRGGDLHVDHIKGWSNYPDLRFDASNCRTLCVKCHYKVTFNKPRPSNSSWGKIKKVRY